jgi:hypothetical protein
MADPDNKDDKKVKDLLDAATRAELERWFGLPSFEQLADAGKRPEPPEDPEISEVRKRRADAIAAVDPAMLEAHRRRVEPPPDLLKFKISIGVRIDPELALFDHTMVDRMRATAEPKELERPGDISDELEECTPQALLRDLHRPELHFEKTFEIVDMSAEQRFDIVAEVARAVTTSLKLPPLPPSPFYQAYQILLEIREIRRQPWTKIQMPNRQVTE